MKDKKLIFMVIGMTMLVIAIVFIWYAMNNPQVSFPWSNTITYLIHLIYTVIMIGCFIFAKGGRKD